MDSGKRIALIVLGLVVVIGALAVIMPRLSRKREAEGEKPWMNAVRKQLNAVRKQLQLDKDKYDKYGKGDKDEYFDLDADSPEEYLGRYDAELNAMVQEGKLTEQQAEAKMTAVRQDIADKMQGGAEKSWK